MAKLGVRVFLVVALVAWFFPTPALTRPGAASPPGTTTADAARLALVTQKLRLVEQLLSSPRVLEVSGGADSESRSALARVRTLLTESRQATDAGQTARAETAVDEALRLATAAIRSRAATAGSDGALTQRNAELREQISVYRGAIAATIAARGYAPRMPALAALDKSVADAEGASTAGRHDEANKSLAQAYRIAVITLSELRAGETITIELKFATLADEFAYELKRHRSHELLVDMAVAERKPTPSAMTSIEQEMAQARGVRARADARAAAGDHAAAIKLMEQATEHLVRALQAAGMPVFK